MTKSENTYDYFDLLDDKWGFLAAKYGRWVYSLDSLDDYVQASALSSAKTLLDSGFSTEYILTRFKRETAPGIKAYVEPVSSFSWTTFRWKAVKGFNEVVIMGEADSVDEAIAAALKASSQLN